MFENSPLLAKASFLRSFYPKLKKYFVIFIGLHGIMKLAVELKAVPSVYGNPFLQPIIDYIYNNYMEIVIIKSILLALFILYYIIVTREYRKYRILNNLDKTKKTNLRSEDLAMIRKLGIDSIGPSFIELNKMEYMFNKCSKGFKLYSYDSNIENFSFFFMVNPINRLGVTDILEGKIETGSDIEERHCASSFNAKGLYIMELFSKPNSLLDAGLGSFMIADFINTQMIKNDISMKYLFTRPVSTEGKKICRKLGFEPITEMSMIWKKDAKPYIGDSFREKVLGRII